VLVGRRVNAGSDAAGLAPVLMTALVSGIASRPLMTKVSGSTLQATAFGLVTVKVIVKSSRSIAQFRISPPVPGLEVPVSSTPEPITAGSFDQTV